MNLVIRRDPSALRKKHNQELVRKMRSGEALWSFDSHASWFPPRPMIRKDPQALNQLYGSSTLMRSRTKQEPVPELQQFELVSPAASADESSQPKDDHSR